ncbi:MAG: hypothetical protein ACOX2A_10250 [Tepidanaerobacteraceae bacterium]|jgi:hypothetical protein|nr:hypothetical protein [Thermoanaerobacterales bacterium]
MELLTINKVMPQLFEYINDPYIFMYELKSIVKELKQKNPILRNYRLMDVGFPSNHNKSYSQMRLYFIKKRG